MCGALQQPKQPRGVRTLPAGSASKQPCHPSQLAAHSSTQHKPSHSPGRRSLTITPSSTASRRAMVMESSLDTCVEGRMEQSTKNQRGLRSIVWCAWWHRCTPAHNGGQAGESDASAFRTDPSFAQGCEVHCDPPHKPTHPPTHLHHSVQQRHIQPATHNMSLHQACITQIQTLPPTHLHHSVQQRQIHSFIHLSFRPTQPPRHCLKATQLPTHLHHAIQQRHIQVLGHKARSNALDLVGACRGRC